MSYADFLHLRVAVDDGVAVVTFDSQQEGDIHRSFFTELRDVFSPLSYDQDVEAVVLAGQGEVFFAGVGRERTARLAGTGGWEAMSGQIMSLKQIVTSLISFRKPTVAAITGQALNIGGQIALLCDAAVASERATFGDDHVAKGVAAGDGGTMLWPLLVGMARAREVLLQNQRISAVEALELHLVSQVVPHDEVVSSAITLAKHLASLPRMPYIGTKLTIANWWHLSSMMSWDLALAVESAGLTQPEYVKKLQGG